MIGLHCQISIRQINKSAVVLLLFLMINWFSQPGFTQGNYIEPTAPQDREDWLEWRIFSALRNTLLPGWISPLEEQDVQTWIGEVHNFKSQFIEANEHVIRMDRACRTRDVATLDAEAKAAGNILNSIKLGQHNAQLDHSSNSTTLQAAASISDNTIVDAVKNALSNANVQNLFTQIGSQFGPIASAMDLKDSINEVYQFTKAYSTNPAAQQRMTEFFGQPTNQVLRQLANAEANHLINERPDLLAAGLHHGVAGVNKNLGKISSGSDFGSNQNSKFPGSARSAGTQKKSSTGGPSTSTDGLPTHADNRPHLEAGEGSKPPPRATGNSGNQQAGGNDSGGGNKKPPNNSNGGNDEPPGDGGGGNKKPPGNSGSGGDDEDPPKGNDDFARLGKTTQDSVLIKLDKYLLNPEHKKVVTNKKGETKEVYSGKAQWFEGALGFNRNNMSDLAKQIQFDPQTAVVTKTTIYGNRYEQTIKIEGANGKSLDVPFIFQRNLDGVVRLVTIGDLKRVPKE